MHMSASDWERAKELFGAALEVEPSERASFLAANCREESVQQQVEKLLTDYQAAGNFLDNPALSSKIPNSTGPAEIQIEEVFRSFLSSEEHQDRAKSEETEDPMVNRRLGAYKLVRRVGRGGMAAVFQAVRADDEYQKEVAVKLVLPGLDSQDVLSRFRNERQTLAGLEHPNIVRLLDGGSAPEGLPFLVMEYVEGSPIDEYCDRHKLSVDERLRLFGEVCDAVQFAHEKLVIHRDLKPTNILVMADGTPKLLDFGIAKVLNPERSTYGWLATQTGLRCMTPAYASPEQTRGKSVSPQTDVYSLGVVLYELLTGHRPYRLTQHSPAEIERAICEQEPEAPSTAISRVESGTTSDGKPITRTPELVSLTREGQPDKLRRRLRGDLDNIVLKALQKETQQRYGSVVEFSQDIARHLQHEPIKARPNTLAYRVSKFAQRHKPEVRAAFAVLIAIALATSFAFNTAGIRDRFAIGSSDSKIQSLAVIPLTNISGDPTQEYFSQGITDALITDLAEIGSLKVISRTSSMQYKDAKKTLPEIARELNVDGIIEGTVQRSGDRVRITAQLIHGPSDKHIWANSYERDMRDIFILERDVTEDIVRQVQTRRSTPEQRSLPQPKPVDPKVLEAYLQGNYHLGRYGEGSGQEEQKKAAEFFQQAIDVDPNFAPAYVGLAAAHMELVLGSSEDVAIRKKSLEKAVEVDPNNSDAYTWLGWLKWQPLLDWQGAESEFRRAIALNPNNAKAHSLLSLLLVTLGRTDEGLRECRIAQQLNPNADQMSKTLNLARDYDGSIANLRMMFQKDPNNGEHHALLFYNYVEKHMPKEAVQELEQAYLLFGESKVADHIRHAYDVAGYRGAIQEWANEMEHAQAAHRVFLPGNLAEAYAILGDKNRAFYWLEQAYEHREMVSLDGGVYFLPAEPMYDPLRSDPRYKDLLRRIGLPSSDAFHASAPQIQSLAVLPLANLSRDPAQEYFSDGMTDALITDLAQIGSLRVISRTSSMQYKQTKRTLPEIARELNVDGIIEGTVQRSGDRVRITANLIQAATDKHVWTRSYERDLRNVLVLQREVASDIAHQIQTQLAPREQAPIPPARSTNLKALEAYLQGNFHLNGYSKGSGDEEKKQAAEYFQQAIDADANFSPAYVGLAKAHLYVNWPSTQNAEILTRATQQALALDANSSDAHELLGEIKDRTWDFKGAEEEFRRATALNPSNAEAHFQLGWILDEFGRWEDGWREEQIAQELNPSKDYLGHALDNRRQIDRAIAMRELIAKRFPEDGYLHVSLFYDYNAKGKYNEAMLHLERLWTLFGFPQVTSEVHRAFLASGYKGALRVSANEMEHLMATKQAYLPVNLAEFYAALGDKNRAFYWLEQSYAKHVFGMSSTDVGLEVLNAEFTLDPLRSDPRFKDLLGRIGLPDVQLTSEKQAQLSGPQPANPKALDAYLRGNYYLDRAQWSVAEDEKRMAAQYFQQAIDADPNFAPAYIGLANAHSWLALGSSEDTAISKGAAERALELDPNSSEARKILGFIKWNAFDWAGAEQDFRRAVALNPNHASSIFALGYLHAAEGRLDEALREGEISQQLDPTENDLSLILEMRGEHKRAIELLQRMVVLHPTDSGNHMLLSRNYAETGMYEEAAQELETSWTLMGAPEIAAAVHRGFAVSGYRGAMSEYAKAVEALQAAKKVFFPGGLAEIYTAVGDKDRAFYWLEQAYEHREDVSLDGGLTTIKEDRLLDPLRTDPRFADLLRRVGLPP
jgi:eukaryotic-like serine/threonine-protein kinase